MHSASSGPTYVTLPPTRAAILALELLEAPETAAANYLNVRRLLLEPEPADTHWVLERQGHLPLLSHQLDFVAFARRLDAVYNGSEQGTGKTRAVLALLQAWGVTRGVVVAPKSLLSQWVSELHELWPQPEGPPLEAYTLIGSLTERRDQLEEVQQATVPVLVLVNYEVLHDLLPDLRRCDFQALVCDEAWRLKSAKARVTRAAWSLSEVCNKCVLLAGTPMGNDVGDLYSQLRLLDPDRWSHWSHSDFMQRFAQFRAWSLGARQMPPKPVGLQDPVGLAQALAPIWHRTPKAACFELPPSRYHTARLDLPTETAQLYAQLRAEGEFALGHELSLADERVVLLRLQQVADGLIPRWGLPTTKQEAEGSQGITTEQWHDITERTGEGQGWLLRQADPNPKLEWLLEWARERLIPHPQARAIVWFRFNAALTHTWSRLCEVIPPSADGTDRVAVAIGATGAEALEGIKASFNSRDPAGVQVICAQYKKLCAGHNLQAADHQVFYSHTWSYLERSQAESRSHRLGREGGVTYWDLLCRGTVDEAIVAALKRKESLSERLTVNTMVQA